MRFWHMYEKNQQTENFRCNNKGGSVDAKKFMRPRVRKQVFPRMRRIFLSEVTSSKLKWKIMLPEMKSENISII